MKLLRLEIVGLYGALTRSIEFNADLTLLVGINGSGKTSILNSIDWLLKLNIPRLAITQFTSISLDFENAGMRHRLVAEKHGKSLDIKLTKGGTNMWPINVKLNEVSRMLDPLEEGGAMEEYSALRPDDKERAAWDYILALPKSTIITLDRLLVAESESRKFEVVTQREYLRLSKSQRSPLTRVFGIDAGEIRSISKKGIRTR